MQNKRGFTLVEILVALFIFTILSMLLVSALRNVMNTQSHTEARAQQLSQLQMALLMTSRDVEQAIDRPITNAQGKQEDAFIGTPHDFTFTHMGGAPVVPQRSGYAWHTQGYWRKTWPAPDQADGIAAHERLLMPDVVDAKFEYLDQSGHFQANWPSHAQRAAAVPRAISLTLTIADWGTVTQVYVIPAGTNKDAA